MHIRLFKPKKIHKEHYILLKMVEIKLKLIFERVFIELNPT